jgi:hypothetical protein
VQIEGKSADEAIWRALGNINTGADGKLLLPILLGKSTTVRLTTQGTWDRAESVSNELPIVIDRKISLSAPGTIKVATPFAISGVVRPRTTGAQVLLMKYVNGAWKNLATTSTDTQGGFTFTITGESRGVARYEVSVSADSIWRQVTAPEFSIIIR